MRITGVRASNLYSFAPKNGTNPGFSLNGLDKALTVLVGPNGAGKTNVLRVIQTILAFLPETHLASPPLEDLRRHVHSPTGDDQPIVLEMSIEFNDPGEQKALSLAWGLAMALKAPDRNNILLTTAMPFETDREWAPLLLSAMNSQAQAEWLFSGTVVLEVAPATSSGLVAHSARYKLAGSPAIEFDLLDNGGSDMLFSEEPDSGGNCVHPSTLYFLTLMADPLLSQVRNVTERPVRIPDISQLPHVLARPVPMRQPEGHSSRRVDTRFGELRQSDGTSGISADAALGHLLTLLGESSYGSKHTSVSWVIARLILQAIVCVCQWQPSDRAKVLSIEKDPDELLSEANLPGFLFALKNGTPLQRETFAAIQARFVNLTHRKVDVSIMPTRLRGPALPWASGSPSVGPELRIPLASVTTHYICDETTPFESVASDNIEHRLRVVAEPRESALEVQIVVKLCERDLPIAHIGSGLLQVLYWCAVMETPSKTVLLLDEPDLHFHPSLASRVAACLVPEVDSKGPPDAASAGGPQVIFISHSPWSVPPGELHRVRRIEVRNGCSGVSPEMTSEKMAELLITKRGRTVDERMFLYSSVTVFVEGANDANALEVWFDRWVKSNHSSSAFETGIHFQPANGKTALAPVLTTALFFGVPSVGLWDTDVLKERAGTGTKCELKDCPNHGNQENQDASNNRKVLESWKKHGLLTDELLQDSGSLYDARGRPVFSQELDVLPKFPSNRVFLLGTKDCDDLESLRLPVADVADGVRTMKQAASDLANDDYYPPLAYALVAKSEPPDEKLEEWLERYGLSALFATIWDLAQPHMNRA